MDSKTKQFLKSAVGNSFSIDWQILDELEKGGFNALEVWNEAIKEKLIIHVCLNRWKWNE